MFIELVDHLRCVRPHDETWLVAAARRSDDSRHIVEGTLGCPICRAEYPVRGAIADFRADDGGIVDGGSMPVGPSDPESAMRLAALLALVDVRGPVVLAGAWGALAPRLADLVPALYLLVNDAPPGALRPEISALRAGGALPLAAGIAHAVALDAATGGDAELVAGAVRCLRTGGRLVAPLAVALPSGVRELARDDHQWLAEREDAGAPVLLRRAPGAGS